MLSTTYCAQNYAGIISLGLLHTHYCMYKYTLLHVQHIQACTHAQTHRDTHVTCTQMHTYKYSYTVALTYVYTQTHTLIILTYTHTHICMDTCTCTHTHTHTPGHTY